MSRIGILLSDDTKERPCLGLALELEDLTNKHTSNKGIMFDLCDTHTDISHFSELDGMILVAQQESDSLKQCLVQFLSAVETNKCIGIIVNSQTDTLSYNNAERLEKILKLNFYNVFDKKLSFTKIQDTFSSSLELIDPIKTEMMIAYLHDFSNYIERNKFASHEVSETI